MKRKLHWYNCCNYGDCGQAKDYAKNINEVTCCTCQRKIKKFSLVDPSAFEDLSMVPLIDDKCPVCGHKEKHNNKGHHASNHFGCPVKGFNVK